MGLRTTVPCWSTGGMRPSSTNFYSLPQEKCHWNSHLWESFMRSSNEMATIQQRFQLNFMHYSSLWQTTAQWQRVRVEIWQKTSYRRPQPSYRSNCLRWVFRWYRNIRRNPVDICVVHVLVILLVVSHWSATSIPYRTLSINNKTNEPNDYCQILPRSVLSTSWRKRL